LQNDAAKNSLWRALSSASGAITPSNSFTDRQPKAPAKQWPKSQKTTLSSGLRHPSGRPRVVRQLIRRGKALIQKKRKFTFEKDKPFESWNKAKDKLTEEEYNKDEGLY